MQFKSINSVNPIDPNDAPAPVTPCKRQCSPSPKEEESTTSPSLANDTQIPTPAPTPTKKARARKTSPSKRSGTLGPLPASYAESGEEDKLLLKMKEVEGKPWTAIQDALEEMTGSKLVGASLRKRYSKMKANFVVFAKEDEDRLLQAKKEVEEKFESEKWQRIADAIEAKGGNKYPNTAIQKKLKELSKKANGATTGSVAN